MRLQPRNGPISRVLDALTFGLSRDPQFKVLNAVVVFHTVFVMYVLECFKCAAKVLRHHFAVLKQAFIFNGLGDVTAFLLSAPPIVTLVKFFAHADTRTGRGAVRHVSVGLHLENGVACGACLINQSRIGSRFTLAFHRAIDAALSVCRLCFKVSAAMWALFYDGWRTRNTVSTSVYSAWHFLLFIGAKESLYPNCKGLSNVS